MLGCTVIHSLSLALLISVYALQSCGKVEMPTNTDENKERSNFATGEAQSKLTEFVGDAVLAPGAEEIALNNENAKTAAMKMELKASLDEKNIEIKQEDHGKTKEVGDDVEKDDEKVENKVEVKTKEGNGRDEAEKEKSDEKVEEGIDLKILDDNNFEHLTQAATGATTGDWLVLFTKKDNCAECAHAEKEMKVVYKRVKHRLNVAKVVQGHSTKLTFKRFDIEETVPVIALFHSGEKYSYENDVSVSELIKFLEGDYRLASSMKVRDPYTPFEYYVDTSVEELKHMLKYRKNVSLLIFIAGFLCGISLTSLCGSVLFHLLENFKDEGTECLREEEPSRDLAAGKNKSD